MEKREDDLVVGGYRFATVADAETARMEIKSRKSGTATRLS